MQVFHDCVLREEWELNDQFFNLYKETTQREPDFEDKLAQAGFQVLSNPADGDCLLFCALQHNHATLTRLATNLIRNKVRTNKSKRFNHSYI
jgi:hypothetical protein